MARVSMKDRAAAVKPVTVAAVGEGSAPVDAAPAAAPAATTTGAESAPTSRINFEIDRAKRSAFKIWCAQNDTTIKDELTAYIDSRIG